MMPATLKEVHEYLIELARKQSNPITYAELAHHFGMTITGDADVGFWSRLLGQISETEHRQGNPMLSVLVINQERNRPGNGFYDLAQQFDKYDGHSDIDRMGFYSRELQAVYDHWALEA